MVTVVTAERVAISHLETISRASHSFLSSILMNSQAALRHMAKLIFMRTLSLIVIVANYTTYVEQIANLLGGANWQFALQKQVISRRPGGRSAIAHPPASQT